MGVTSPLTSPVLPYGGVNTNPETFIREKNEQKEFTTVSIIHPDKQAVLVPERLKVSLKEDEEVAFYIPAKRFWRLKSFWFVLTFCFPIIIIGACASNETGSSNWTFASIVGLFMLLTYIFVISQAVPRKHFIITNKRIISVTSSLIHARTTDTFSLSSLVKPLIVLNEHYVAITALYNSSNVGSLKVHAPAETFIIRGIANVPAVIEHLNWSFSRVIASKRWNEIPNTYVPVRVQTTGTPGSMAAFVAVLLLEIALLSGFGYLYGMIFAYGFDYLIGIFLIPFGVCWHGFMACMLYQLWKHYKIASMKNTERFVGIADNRRPDQLRDVLGNNNNNNNNNNNDVPLEPVAPAPAV